jgi:RimJ/RimL family protein N-acetyltransferase
VPEVTFSSARLLASPVQYGDLDDVLAVRLSNPERLARTEGPAGEPDKYDREMLERDLMIIAVEPTRDFLTLRVRDSADGGADGDGGPPGPVIGIVDLVVTNPRDGHPWLGVVEIAAPHHRQGYGREAVLAATGYLAGLHPEWSAVRAVIDADDAAALAFARDCGFAHRAASAGLRPGQVLMELDTVRPVGVVDWHRIPGPPGYEPGKASEAADALASATSPRLAAKAVSDLRFAVCDDQRGTLYPAAVPATAILLRVINSVPGEPRTQAFTALLHWWGRYEPQPGFEVYHDPATGPAMITDAIAGQVREAVPMLARVAGEKARQHQRAVARLLHALDAGWMPQGAADGPPRAAAGG